MIDGGLHIEEECLGGIDREYIQGENGATFIPHVSEDCILSWTNNKGLPNPDPIFIGIKAEVIDGKLIFKGGSN